jgi:acetoin utilization protein AcuA
MTGATMELQQPEAEAPTEARIVVGADAALLAGLEPHQQLDRFRPPEKQLEALIDIATDPQGTITALVRGRRLLGYVAFHPPTEIESWGADRTKQILELGAVEVAPEERGRRWAERMLLASFDGGRFDHTVVFATLYTWHYDLERSGLGDFAYKRMLERLYRSAGLEPFGTTDEEVRSSPANALMARLGPLAPAEVVAEFHRLRRLSPEVGGVGW